jgi:hypothetical protein
VNWASALRALPDARPLSNLKRVRSEHSGAGFWLGARLERVLDQKGAGSRFGKSPAKPDPGIPVRPAQPVVTGRQSWHGRLRTGLIGSGEVTCTGWRRGDSSAMRLAARGLVEPELNSSRRSYPVGYSSSARRAAKAPCGPQASLYGRCPSCARKSVSTGDTCGPVMSALPPHTRASKRTGI